MSITDAQFRIAVGVAGVALVTGIAVLRFSGPVSLPPKPPPPVSPQGTSSELLSRSAASPVVYQDFVARDAAGAGVRAPSLEELSRKWPYLIEDARHVIEVGQAPIEVAGVALRALHTEEGLALEITNTTGSDIAYHVVSVPVPAAGCDAVSPRLHNALTIHRGASEVRAECIWRTGAALAITRVETMEVLPLSAWYLGHVPPEVVGIEPRLARGARVLGQGSDGGGRCSAAVPQALRSGLERGEIGWRDLADFYARHRCQTYHFPLSYKAFSSDSERSVPVAPPAM